MNQSSYKAMNESKQNIVPQEISITSIGTLSKKNQTSLQEEMAKS